MKALLWFDRYWFAAMPAKRLALLRILCGAFALIYLVVRCGHLTSYLSFPERNFQPVGIVSLLDAPLTPVLGYSIFGLTLIAGAAFVVGARYRVSGPLFALGFLWITSYRNSWGMIFHTDNMLSLHLLLLALAPANATWAVDAREQRVPDDAGRFGWAVRAMCWVTITSYLLAGIAKLHASGLTWGEGEILRTHVAYDAVRKIELASIHSPVGAWLVQFEWPFSVLGWLTLVLELGAPLAMAHRHLRTGWVLGIWSFHVGVILLMAITFVYPVSGCAFACFFPLERLQHQPRLKWLFARLDRYTATST